MRLGVRCASCVHMRARMSMSITHPIRLYLSSRPFKRDGSPSSLALLVFLLRVLCGDRRVGGRRDALSQSYFMFRPYRNYPCAFRTCFKTLHFSHSGKNTLANGIRLTTSRVCSRKTNGDGIQYSYKFRGSVGCLIRLQA